MTMKTIRHQGKTIAILAILVPILAVAMAARAESPPTHTAPAPLFKAAEAARLADEYVAKTFPEFPAIYCSELSYESQQMKPDKTVTWRLRYVIPNNPGKAVDGTPFRDWGFCLVYVHEEKSVTHTTKPTRNQNAEQGGADQPATAPESKSEGNKKPKPESEGRFQ
jgi:hypothetical protein